jgi:hypothetical protein
MISWPNMGRIASGCSRCSWGQSPMQSLGIQRVLLGVSGFLRKFWSMFFEGENDRSYGDRSTYPRRTPRLHTCIKKVTDDIERMSMNTCVSHFMIATNDLRSLKCSKRAVLEPLVVSSRPLARTLQRNFGTCWATKPRFVMPLGLC